MASGLTNTLPRSSCGKCVKVLKELISGLGDDNSSSSSSSSNDSKETNGTDHQQGEKTTEPPPLTLLRAIARSSQHHPHHDQWGQELHRLRRRRRRQQQQQQQQQQQFEHSTQNSIHRTLSTSRIKERRAGARELPPPLLQIEETDDGVRLTIPVETTVPALMKRWTMLEQQRVEEQEDQEDEEEKPTEEKDGDNDGCDDDGYDELLDDFVPLATSVRSDRETASSPSSPNPSAVRVRVRNPLTIELKCRRCDTTGPEAGARAFLMGPEPLSIVLCHNRIHSDADEVEEILTHELIHLYDVQTLQLDLADCETVAYSEVRAAREAECARGLLEAATAAKANRNDGGETASANNNDKATDDSSSSSSSSRNPWSSSLTGMQTAATNLKESISENVIRPYCVKSIALGATQNMFPSRGKACLNKVWETAYADHRPFPRSKGSNSASTTSSTSSTSTSTSTSNANSAEQHANAARILRTQRRASGHSGTSHGTSGK